jgi:hypothetical protein
MKLGKLIPSASVLSLALFLTTCKKGDEAPTKLLMQGTWELTEAQDQKGRNILSKVSFPVTAIQLTDDNGMVGTQGPMFTYLVYGDSKWIEVSAAIKQLFDYANFRFNTGEYFVDGGVTSRFTVEAKLQATAAAGGLVDILNIMDIGEAWLQQVIYHKFMDVRVSFPSMYGKENETMVWEFDNTSHPVYSYKNSKGELIAWAGWPTEGFMKARFVFTKRTKGLNDLVREHK